MEDLKFYRSKIDEIDESIIKKLGERFCIIHKIALFKRKKNIPMMQSNRVKEVFETRKKSGQLVGLREELIEELFQVIINNACKIENEIIDASKREGK
ncbi:chorismate mutase [Paramaledivibacter caminithermalis]|jgi:chorismate mutase|uniref:Chorismate mutase n=1 Tax=Paramaledivibacter caminithermalis (strain DSM 15212 / CIP 107654 / DViRD3) TaxID=1121301 RepID=A0A1M6T544_PARC5|nr:chorismate mutase [Paramaledivibacter caminithermalis]SHK51986.1 chorismate mutase [Paramaledivibacter caminithermalis DSM 15212]